LSASAGSLAGEAIEGAKSSIANSARKEAMKNASVADVVKADGLEITKPKSGIPVGTTEAAVIAVENSVPVIDKMAKNGQEAESAKRQNQESPSSSPDSKDSGAVQKTPADPKPVPPPKKEDDDE